MEREDRGAECWMADQTEVVQSDTESSKNQSHLSGARSPNSLGSEWMTERPRFLRKEAVSYCFSPEQLRGSCSCHSCWASFVLRWLCLHCAVVEKSYTSTPKLPVCSHFFVFVFLSWHTVSAPDFVSHWRLCTFFYTNKYGKTIDWLLHPVASSYRQLSIFAHLQLISWCIFSCEV